MPNNKYLRSTKRERQLVNEARAKGAIAARSAGSHSPVDVWSFYPGKNEVYLIQVKTEKGASVSVDKDKKVFKNCTVTMFTRSWEK